MSRLTAVPVAAAVAALAVRAARAAGHQVGIGQRPLAGRIAVLRGRLDPRQRPASEQEWRIRAVLAGHGAGMTVDEVLAGDEVAGRAMAMIRGWASDGLTRYDGDVSRHGIPGPADAGQVVSPTALEEWARCPHAYFVRRLLRVEPPGTPEELIKISPLEAGSLIHEVLDRFFTEQSLAGAVPGGGQRWSDAQRGELERVVLEVAAEFESRGVTGHPLLWRQERDRIAVDLQLLLDDDERLRGQSGRVQVESELTFGIREHAAVRVGLPDSREIWFRGNADRVDRAGSALVVVDYKTGSAGPFKMDIHTKIRRRFCFDFEGSGTETRPLPRSVRPAR